MGLQKRNKEGGKVKKGFKQIIPSMEEIEFNDLW
jgi:hypothetical protein